MADETPDKPATNSNFWRDLISIFTTRDLVTKTLVLTVLFALNSLTYHTVYYNIENLPGDPYVMFAIMAILEIPSAVFNAWAIEKFGRIRSGSVLMLVGKFANVLFTRFIWFANGLGGLASLITAVIPQNLIWAIVTLAGKSSNSSIRDVH